MEKIACQQYEVYLEVNSNISHDTTATQKNAEEHGTSKLLSGQ